MTKFAGKCKKVSILRQRKLAPLKNVRHQRGKGGHQRGRVQYSFVGKAASVFLVVSVVP